MGVLPPAGLVEGTGLDIGGVAGVFFREGEVLVMTGLRLIVGLARPLLLVGVALMERIVVGNESTL